MDKSEPEPSIFPEISAIRLVERVKSQFSYAAETLYARCERLPKDSENLAVECKHIVYDSYVRGKLSVELLNSLMARDIFTTAPVLRRRESRAGILLLAETYFWTAFCLIGYECGALIGGLPLVSSFVEGVIYRVNAVFLAVFILPIFMHTLLRNSLVSDDTRRLWAFRYASLLGILFSYGAGSFGPNLRLKVWTPPLFILPYVIGWTCVFSAYYKWLASSRILFRILILDIPLAVYVIFAWIAVGSCSRVILYWSMGICTTAMIDFQFKMGRLRRCWASESLEQWSTTVVYIFAHLMIRTMIYAGLYVRSKLERNADVIVNP